VDGSGTRSPIAASWRRVKRWAARYGCAAGHVKRTELPLAWARNRPRKLRNRRNFRPAGCRHRGHGCGLSRDPGRASLGEPSGLGVMLHVSDFLPPAVEIRKSPLCARPPGKARLAGRGSAAGLARPDSYRFSGLLHAENAGGPAPSRPRRAGFSEFPTCFGPVTSIGRTAPDSCRHSACFLAHVVGAPARSWAWRREFAANCGPGCRASIGGKQRRVLTAQPVVTTRGTRVTQRSCCHVAERRLRAGAW
jgi:hypothetical protein